MVSIAIVVVQARGQEKALEVQDQNKEEVYYKVYFLTCAKDNMDTMV